jgi:hypothetical protein
MIRIYLHKRLFLLVTGRGEEPQIFPYHGCALLTELGGKYLVCSSTPVLYFNTTEGPAHRPLTSIQRRADSGSLLPRLCKQRPHQLPLRRPAARAPEASHGRLGVPTLPPNRTSAREPMAPDSECECWTNLTQPSTRTHVAHSPAHRRWWAWHAGRFSRRCTPGAWLRPLAALAPSPPVGPSSAAPPVPSAGVSNAKAADTRGLPGGGPQPGLWGWKRRPQGSASAGRRPMS